MTDIPARPTRRIQAGSIRLAFRAWTAAPGARPEPGSPPAPPLVLLHGQGDDSSGWGQVALGLVPSWRVYAPDLRGHGDSEHTGPCTLEQLTADLEAFLDALGLRRVALAGHALGAAPACLFAARHPDRVTRLVLEEPGPPDDAEVLTDIKVPTLLISGGPAGHADAGRLAETAALIPDCSLITVGGGHRAHVAAAGEFTAAVAAFLRGS